MVVDGKPVTVKISARALKTLKGTGRKAKTAEAAAE
jgi:ribosomal protein L28